MAAVIAIEHEQLFALAQAPKAGDLRLGHAGVLRQDVASCGRDDPARRAAALRLHHVCSYAGCSTRWSRPVGVRRRSWHCRARADRV